MVVPSAAERSKRRASEKPLVAQVHSQENGYVAASGADR
jgi:hypothetical protein